ncbi:glycosyltransferase family 9 protein [Mucilaginibacter sp.]|uniref:glycosyltransferase family 9 protein n=1 Tax=Mucilaginibacter sp. TaxID=1882438 RepID=UPI003264BB2E
MKRLNFLVIRLVIPTILKALFTLFPRREKTLLIIKNDGIGDYILFRNCFQFLKRSEKYKGYKIYVLANMSSKELALHLDTDTVSRFFWYADGFFLKWDLISLLLALQRLRPQSVFYTNYSRRYQTDWLVNKIVAKHKIGIDGDTVNEMAEEKTKSDRFYTQLLKTTHHPQHEFVRNRQMCEALTGEACNITKPYIDTQKLNSTQHNSVVMFIGGSTSDKRWPVYHVAEFCKTVISKQRTNIILAGGLNDVSDAEKIQELVAWPQLSSKVGLLSLTELAGLLAGASLLVSNDTMAVHLAVAVDIPVVCIAKGDLFARFAPYPGDIYLKLSTVMPTNFIPNKDSFHSWSSAKILDVDVAEIYHAAQTFLIKQPTSINWTSPA